MKTGENRVVILTEDSHTVADSSEVPALEFFNGTFNPVRAMAKSLTDVATVEVVIMSDEYGVLRGSDVVEDAEQAGGYDDRTVVDAFLQEVADADGVAILLTADAFTRLIAQNWQSIVEVAPEESVWCLGASTTALARVDTSQLQAAGCRVIEYERKGVARIGLNAREEFLQAVRQRVG